MPDPIDFYFDFSSPYGYLASTRIDAIAARHGRDVTWRPFVLGAAFKVTGQQPLVEQPLRGEYAKRDFARSARLLGVPLKLPERFPFFGLAASRACYWIEDAARARALAKAIYHAAFGEGRDVTPVASVAEIARPSSRHFAAIASELHSTFKVPGVARNLHLPRAARVRAILHRQRG